MPDAIFRAATEDDIPAIVALLAAAHRGAGLGRAMIAWALDRARARGCGLAQLTSDKRRADAIRFYESLGFEPTHEGMKLAL